MQFESISFCLYSKSGRECLLKWIWLQARPEVGKRFWWNLLWGFENIYKIFCSLLFPDKKTYYFMIIRWMILYIHIILHTKATPFFISTSPQEQEQYLEEKYVWVHYYFVFDRQFVKTFAPLDLLVAVRGTGQGKTDNTSVSTEKRASSETLWVVVKLHV